MMLSFEVSVKRLEEIVAEMEKGNLSLEDSVALFKEGFQLSRDCNAILDEAKKRIEAGIKEKIKDEQNNNPDANEVP